MIENFSGWLQPDDIFSIKPLQFWRGPCLSAFLKILAECRSISTDSSVEIAGSFATKSSMGANFNFERALTFGCSWHLTFIDIFFLTSSLFVILAFLLIVSFGFDCLLMEHAVIHIPWNVPFPSRVQILWSTLSATNWVNSVISDAVKFDSSFIKDCLYLLISS